MWMVRTKDVRLLFRDPPPSPPGWTTGEDYMLSHSVWMHGGGGRSYILPSDADDPETMGNNGVVDTVNQADATTDMAMAERRDVLWRRLMLRGGHSVWGELLLRNATRPALLVVVDASAGATWAWPPSVPPECDVHVALVGGGPRGCRAAAAAAAAALPARANLDPSRCEPAGGPTGVRFGFWHLAADIGRGGERDDSPIAHLAALAPGLLSVARMLRPDAVVAVGAGPAVKAAVALVPRGAGRCGV